MSNKGTEYEKKLFKKLNDKGCIFPGTTNAGGGSGADLCLTHNQKVLKVECKSNGADWGQETIKYIGDKWVWNKDNKTTEYYKFIDVISMIDQEFIPKNSCPSTMTSAEWRKERKNIIGVYEKNYDQAKIEQTHIEISLEPLIHFYNSKDCFYLQVKKYGFYHLGKDKYNLGTQPFDGSVDLRFRAKMHDNFHRRVTGTNIKNTSRVASEIKKMAVNGGDISQTAMKELILEGLEKDSFDPDIFIVSINNQPVKIKSYQEAYDLVDTIDGHNKEAVNNSTSVKIIKLLDPINPHTFTIVPTPWDYDFYGVMKLDKVPTPSIFNLEPNASQSFPKIKYL